MPISTGLRLLLVEDSAFDARLISEQLRQSALGEFSLRHVDRLELARMELATHEVDCVLLDLNLPDATRLQGVESLLATSPDVPLVVLSASDEVLLGAEAVQAGAQDYLAKGEIDGRQLWRAIRYALERKKTELMLRHQALHDALTGLPNRSLFIDRLAVALARLRREPGQVAVMFLDLDGFKWVNDSLGHDAGDAVVVEVARRIQRALRPYDTAARIGGDEFLILAEGPDDGLEAATRLAERVQERLATPIRVEATDVRVSASIGITRTTDGATSPAALIRDADAAMYRAKALGKNRYALFDDSMREQVRQRLLLLNELHRALESRDFSVLYQPIVSLDDGTVRGWEAQLRWKQPDGQPLPSKELIEVLEDHGLLVPVGNVVMETALTWLGEHCRSLPEGTCAPYMSLNVSAGQLGQEGVVDDIAELIRTVGIRPEQVHLELSEGQLISAQDTLRSRMEELKKLGLSLAMDDYGVGHSTVRHLQELPFDVMKIHPSFVAALDASEADRNIVRAVVSIGLSLGLVVIADGVETEDQARMLAGMGCQLGQGEHFGAPRSNRPVGVA